jgi:hypothetical protein
VAGTAGLVGEDRPSPLQRSPPAPAPPFHFDLFGNLLCLPVAPDDVLHGGTAGMQPQPAAATDTWEAVHGPPRAYSPTFSAADTADPPPSPERCISPPTNLTKRGARRARLKAGSITLPSYLRRRGRKRSATPAQAAAAATARARGRRGSRARVPQGHARASAHTAAGARRLLGRRRCGAGSSSGPAATKIRGGIAADRR